MISNDALVGWIRGNPVIVGCLVLSAALAGGIYYRSSARPEAEQLIDQKSSEGRRLAFNVRNSAQLPDHLAAMSAAVAEIEPRLIRGDELATNLQYFYKLEAETGTKLLDLRRAASAPVALPAPKGAAKPSFSAIPFTLSVEGDYPALIDFLRRLETGIHFSRITLASMSVIGTDRSGRLGLQLSVELLGQP